MALFIFVFSLILGLIVIGILQTWKEEGSYKNAVESVNHAAALVEGYDEDSAANIGLVL
jgi:hypothetical protein